MKDYSRIKALAAEILQCIGDEPEGEHPSLPDVEHENELAEGSMPHIHESKGGQEPQLDLSPATKKIPDGDFSEEGKRKKRKDDVIALFASTLASKFNK